MARRKEEAEMQNEELTTVDTQESIEDQETVTEELEEIDEAEEPEEPEDAEEDEYEEETSEETETEKANDAEEVTTEFKDDEEIVLPEEKPEPRSYRSSLLPEGIGGNNRIDVAGKRKKRSLYAQEEVHTRNGIRRVKKEDTIQYKEYMELAASIKNGTILSGQLTSRRETENGDVLAEVRYGETYTVCIPAYLLCDMSLQPRTDMEPNNQFKDLINRRIGTTIDFVVMYVDEKKSIAYGSHIEAMVRLARRTYQPPRGGGEPELKAGLLAEAQVMQTNTRGIWIEVAGSECFIEKNEISWARVADPSEDFVVGQMVDVRILDVKPHTIEIKSLNRKINTVKIQASVKQVKMNPNEKEFNNIPVGSSALALVTQITEFGIFVIYNDKISVKCKLFDGPKQPKIGSKVLVTIERKYEDTHQFDGKINFILSEPVM